MYSALEGDLPNEILEFDDEQYDDLKITFRTGGKQYRTVSFSDISNFSVVEDIPQEIYNNGHYQENQLVGYLNRMAKEYAKKMVTTR